MAMNMVGNKELRLKQREFAEKLIEETEQNVAAMLYHMTQDSFLVEDVMIATWTTLCQKISVVEKHENPHGWIMNTAKFKMLQALEKRQHISEHEMYVLDRLEIYMEEEERIQIEIMEVLKKYLKEEERKIVVLKYFYDVPYSDLAEYFHCSETAVRKKASRAIGKLRKKSSDIWNF